MPNSDAKKIRLATRGSPLALKQAEMVAAYLGQRMAGAEFEIVEIKTTGDKKQEWSLEKFGGKGLFTKEIEDALLAGSADIAVHSAKDLPTENPDGLSIVGCLPRDADRDVLAVRDGVDVPLLIASGSPRRRAQLKKILPAAVWTEFRGNVETRLKKLSDGAADATVLSEAGLLRLGISEFEGVKFKPLKLDVCVPAVGQGIIALQCRDADIALYRPHTDAATNETLSLEREFLTALGGGCQTAFAANYDGELFRFFYEDIGYQKIPIAQSLPFNQKVALVKEVVSGL